MDYYQQAFDKLGKAVDCFMPAAGIGQPARDATRLAHEMGRKLWWYYVGDIVYIPTQGSYTRSTFWGHWKYGVPGLLHWGMSYWGQENIAGKDGKKWPDVEWNAISSRGGDGYLVYPAGPGKFWPSIRLEHMRDGVEDYECLVMLESLVSRVEKKDTAKYSVQLAAARDVLTSARALDQTIDAGLIGRVREAVAHQIVTMSCIVDEKR